MKIKKCDDIECQNSNCYTASCGLCCTKIEKFGVKYEKTEILKDINIHIHCGELTAIIGPNGAGKSTLLKSILGEVKHTGSLRFLDAKGMNTNKPIIGYVPQNIEFDRTAPISVRDFFTICVSNHPVWFSRSKTKEKDIREKLKKVNSEYIIDRKIGELSGGELQRLLLAIAISPVPHILLLDEPVSGVDHSGLKMFYELVSDLRNMYDMTIILVSHDLDLVNTYADRVIFLNKTIECVGTPKEVFKSKKVIETFGLNLTDNFSREG